MSLGLAGLLGVSTVKLLSLLATPPCLRVSVLLVMASLAHRALRYTAICSVLELGQGRLSSRPWVSTSCSRKANSSSRSPGGHRDPPPAQGEGTPHPRDWGSKRQWDSDDTTQSPKMKSMYVRLSFVNNECSALMISPYLVSLAGHHL